MEVKEQMLKNASELLVCQYCHLLATYNIRCITFHSSLINSLCIQTLFFACKTWVGEKVPIKWNNVHFYVYFFKKWTVINRTKRASLYSHHTSPYLGLLAMLAPIANFQCSMAMLKTSMQFFKKCSSPRRILPFCLILSA